MAQPAHRRHDVGHARGIVTPEAVLLEFQTASVPTRVLSFSVDVLVQLAALFLVFLVFGLASADLSIPTWVGVIFVTVTLFIVLLGYPVAMETLWNGRTLGLAAAGLRVVTKEGAPVRFRHAAVRGALGLVDFWLVPVAVVATLSVLLTRDNQRLGDLAAGTIVLRERSARDRTGEAVTFYPPPGYEQYAASLEVGSLRPEQYGVIRSFLLRLPELSFAARTHLAFEMANPVATAIRHDPPPGVHPEVFLACVAAAYQWREGATAGARPPVTAPSPFGAPPPPPPPPPSGGPTEDAEPGFVPPT